MDHDETYANRYVLRRKKTEKEASSVSPVCNFLSRILGTILLLLLGVVIALMILTIRSAIQNRSNSETPDALTANCNLQIHLNPGFVFEGTSMTLEALKDFLCDELKESTCVICPYNWLRFRGRCYFISEEFKSWASSKEYCISQQSHLAILDDDFLEDIEMSRRSFWIGLQYNDITSEWTWINGSTLRKGSIPVNTHEPGNNCGFYWHKEITPLNCSYNTKWICQKEAILLDKKCFVTSY
ncbi:natural killer cells antigen CD94-like [Lissotriton helveticus]